MYRGSRAPITHDEQDTDGGSDFTTPSLIRYHHYLHLVGSDGGPLYLLHVKNCICNAPTPTLTAVLPVLLVRDSGLLFIHLFIFYYHRVLVEKLSVILDYGGSMGDSLGIHPSELRGMDLGS